MNTYEDGQKPEHPSPICVLANESSNCGTKRWTRKWHHRKNGQCLPSCFRIPNVGDQSSEKKKTIWHEREVKLLGINTPRVRKRTRGECTSKETENENGGCVSRQRWTKLCALSFALLYWIVRKKFLSPWTYYVEEKGNYENWPSAISFGQRRP